MIYNDEQNNNPIVSSEIEQDQTNQQPTKAELMEKFMKEYFKQIPVAEILPADRIKIQDGQNLLIMLKAEVIARRADSLEKKDFIKTKVSSLKTSDRVNIDDQEFSKTEEGVMEFVHLLDKMIAEIDSDILFYTHLLSDTPPTYVAAYLDESDDFRDYVEARVSSIRKYVKNAKRDLTVSYSRYCFAFDSQIRQIMYVESFLKRVPKKEASQEATSE